MSNIPAKENPSRTVNVVDVSLNAKINNDANICGELTTVTPMKNKIVFNFISMLPSETHSVNPQ